MRLFSTTMLVTLAMAVSATAQTTWYVDDVNCPGSGSGTIADPFCSIQDAIAAASNNDEIIVAPGEYFETIDLGGEAIHLHSSEGADVTTINGLKNGAVVTCENGEGPDTIVEGFTILNGRRPDGGGVRIIDSSPTIIRCRIIQNAAEDGFENTGGGAYIELGSPMFVGCTFASNVSQDQGGGAYNVDSSPTFVNCIFDDNSSPLGSGGGVYNDSSDTTLTNCTFYQNEQSLQSVDSSTVTVANCILRGSSSPEIIDSGGSVTTVTYSNIEGGWGGAGSNNIDAAARFYGPAIGDFRLNSFSPCIDAGNNDVLLPAVMTDRAGNPRRADDAAVADTGAGGSTGPPVVDIGAFERQDDSGALVVVPGASIQHAIDLANTGEEIIVMPGTYNEAIDLLGKVIHLRSADGPDVTTIDATGFNESVVTCGSGEQIDTVIEGFTIANGAGHADGPDQPTYGGGLRVVDPADGLTVIDCIIEQNEADHGSALYAMFNAVDMTGCIIRDNTTLVDAVIGLISAGCTLENCLIADNDGVAIIGNPVTLSMSNCTVSGNIAGAIGAITVLGDLSTLTASNSIIWGNSSPQIQLADGATANITFCDVQNGWMGTGNIDADPLFAIGPMGGHYLSQTTAGQGVDSPCVDAGSVSAMSAMLTDRTTRTDQIGDAGTVDLGYHSVSSVGACCFHGGGCVLLSESDCNVAAGQWQGPGVDCGSIICFPTGACCLPDGSCMDDVLDTNCLDMGGTFQGDSIACTDVTCPAPLGACCLIDGGCLVLTEMDCAQIPGSFWGGFGTDCSDSDMNGAADFCEAPPCPADLTADGAVDVFDLFELLNNWGADGPGADLAAPNNIVDVFDLFELLSAWGSCA